MLRILSFLLLLFLPQTASAAWHEARSDHFVVYSDDSADNIRKFAARLEQFDGALRAATGVPAMPGSASTRVTIYMVDDLADIWKLSGSSNIWGFMRNDASGSVAFVPRRSETGKFAVTAQNILLHEYAHHFMFQSWGDTIFPLWFQEGFAELFATARFETDGTLLLGAAPGFRAWGIRDSTILPARNMLKLNPGRLSREQRQMLYSRGWLAMHYLMFDTERSGQLKAYMRAINSGTNADAASAVFGDLSSFDRSLTRYARRPKLPALAIKEGLNPAAIAIRPLSAGEAATMEARIHSTRGVDEKTAPQVVAEARKAAAPFSEDAGAQSALAEAEYDVGAFAAAETAADRALRADPKSVHAMIYKGLAMQARLAKKAGASEADWKEVRRWFLAANRIDPEYAWPLILFYDSYRAAGQPATENAIAGLLYARVLAPFDSDLRIEATRVLIGQKKLPEARAAFAPIAYRAEQTTGSRDWALAVIAALDAKDADGAMAAMNRTPVESEPESPEGKDKG